MTVLSERVVTSMCGSTLKQQARSRWFNISSISKVFNINYYYSEKKNNYNGSKKKNNR